ncbi:hypothetical protein OAO21_00725 [Alphaproteobacteria bacterium]|nr:hypothetical protein [Alphaproteobacteria bacterium]
MKQLFIIILFLPLLGCVNIIKDKQTSTDFNCPTVFFSSDDRVYIDSGISFDDITIKAEFNNYALNNKCQQQDNLVVIPLDILIVAKPMNSLEESVISLPVYISLLDDNDDILETQYFSVSGLINQNSETNIFIESDITDRLQIVTQQLETTQLILGFMLDNEKKDLLN